MAPIGIVMTGIFGRVAGSLAGLLALGAALGCGSFGAGFFQNPNNSGTATTSGLDYVYTVNTGNTLSEFAVGSGALTAVSGSPIALPTGLAASSVTVTRPDTYVYVGGAGGIVCYSIGSTGALTQVSGGGFTSTSTNFVSLTTSPDGQWLIALEAVSNEIYVFGINTSTGVLKVNGSPLLLSPPSGVTAAAKQVQIAPNASLIAAAMGPAGDYIFPFTTSSGSITTSGYTTSPISGYSDDSIAFDATSAYLFIGRGIASTGSSEILSYSVSGTGSLGSSPNVYSSGQDPYSLLVDLTGAYLYSANKATVTSGSSSYSTVSGYSISTGGVLAATPNSPYTSGSGVTALAEDNSKKYVIAAASGGTGTTDLTLYEFDALNGGQLDAIASIGNGSNIGSVAVATTH